MVKNRLLEVQKVSNPSLDSSLKENVVESGSNMEAILSPYTEIRINLRRISTNLETMRRMVQTVNIRNENEKEMENLCSENLRAGNFLMNQFQALKANLPDGNDYSLESRIKRTLFHGLYQNYLIVWNENEEFLRSNEKQVKKLLKTQARLVNLNPDEEELEKLIENKDMNLFVGNILEQTKNERNKLRDLMDRLSELKRIEKSIEDVHALFMRIQYLVIEQSEVFNRIEFHANETSFHTNKGANELDKAEKHHKNAVKKKCWIIVILSIILVFFIIIAIFF